MSRRGTALNFLYLYIAFGLAGLGVKPGTKVGPAQLTCPKTDTDHSDQSVPVLFAPLFLEGRAPVNAGRVAELQALAGGRAGLLAEVAGLFEGTSEGEPDEPLARSAARLAGWRALTGRLSRSGSPRAGGGGTRRGRLRRPGECAARSR